jgi:hypothetical protein
MPGYPPRRGTVQSALGRGSLVSAQTWPPHYRRAVSERAEVTQVRGGTHTPGPGSTHRATHPRQSEPESDGLKTVGARKLHGIKGTVKDIAMGTEETDGREHVSRITAPLGLGTWPNTEGHLRAGRLYPGQRGCVVIGHRYQSVHPRGLKGHGGRYGAITSPCSS